MAPGRPAWLKPPKKKYNYVPPPSSGAHLILVSLLKAEQHEFNQNFTKQQVLDHCIKYSQSGMKDNSKIWACMKGLIDKSLVSRQIARDPLYFLSDEGRDLARKLIALSDGTDVNEDEDTNPGDGVIFSQEDANGNFVLTAGTYDIILVIDQREKIDIMNFDQSLKVEVRTLSCGDFIWVAKPKGISPSDRTKDLVLDYVIERKRLDDLSQSIFDGRFQQQKQRLQSSGIRRPVYLIEDTAQLRSSNLTSAGLAQAVVNILIHDGIGVEKAKNVSHANDYLISMTKCLSKYYSNIDLKSCDQERLKSGEASKNEMMTYSEFQTKGAKITNWTVHEMFAKHLIQLTGMSDVRVSVIIKKYPTLCHLIESYESCQSEKERESMLSKLVIPDSNRTIGPALSRRIYCCYKTVDM